MLRKMRAALAKEAYQPITIKEFGAYYKVAIEDVIDVIRENDKQFSTEKPTTSPVPATDKPINHSNKTLQKETEPYKFQSKPWRTTNP